jgi:hypothetical protein
MTKKRRGKERERERMCACEREETFYILYFTTFNKIICLLFEQGVLYFHFALTPAKHVAAQTTDYEIHLQ